MPLRIVHVVSHPFLPCEDGGRLKTACLAAALARHGEVQWVSLEDQHRRKGAGDLDVALELPGGGGGRMHRLLGSSYKRTLPRSWAGWWCAARAGVHLPLAWMPYTPRHGAAMARIASLEPDLVVADETMLAPLAAFAPARWRVVHTHNHESKLMAQDVFSPAIGGHQARAARRLGRFEQELFPGLDQVWGVRPEDLEGYQAQGVDPARLFLVPNVVPESCFEADPRPAAPGSALFFGSWWYPPNQDGLARLLELWPELRRRLPAARLLLAGRGLPSALEARAAATEGVVLLGFVPDLRALLRSVSVVVLPLAWGGGTKIKTIEALAAARPVLATPVAAEGLGLADGRHARVLPLGEAFLEALGDMVSDPGAYQAMALRGQAHAAERFSMAALLGSLDRALEAMLASSRVRP